MSANSRRFILVIVYVAVAMTAFVRCGASTPTPSKSPESAAIITAVEVFVREFYGEGDTTNAYAMLASAIKQTCEPTDFAKRGLVAKQLVANRHIAVIVEDVKLNATGAQVQLIVTTDRQVADFVPQTIGLVNEGGDWRIVLTSDPTCRSNGAFFDLGTPSPTIRVTPVYEGDSRCERGYPFNCVPLYPPKLDCKDVPYRNFPVEAPDPHGFDPDGNHIGCEMR